MRPDVSLSISCAGVPPEEKTWLHFDAKYRVRTYTKEFEDEDRDDEVTGHAVPTDLAKMHAYRDAIRRSAGAYVVYPGDTPLTRGQYHELLPGLGAFALRPSSTGEADHDSSKGLERFISDVIDHLSSQGTSYQRDRFWRSEAHDRAGYLSARRNFLKNPPSDTNVLLGYLRNPQHEVAVLELALYNLRADPGRDGMVNVESPEIGAQFVVLYGQGRALVYETTGDVVLKRKSDLAVAGYVPNGDLYLCLGINPEPVFELEQDAIMAMIPAHAPIGHPLSTTWAAIEPDRKAPRS